MITNKTIASVIDLTLLKTDASDNEIKSFLLQTKHYDVAAICLFPKHFINLTTPPHVKRATVINFPSGNEEIGTSIAALSSFITIQLIDEIDYVFPYQLYLNGSEKKALSRCHTLIEFCRSHGLTNKIILETGCFINQEVLFKVANQVIEVGADFLKTSTGFTPVGATPQAVQTLLDAIKQSNTETGIKISGGVSTINQAKAYIEQAENTLNKPIDATWFRIGSSQLLSTIIHDN